MQASSYGANIELISIDTIRAANDKAHVLHDLVVLFVGGTGGIGASTAKELFVRTIRPKAYIVGRNADAGRQICTQLRELNPSGTAIFLQHDLSTIAACDAFTTDFLRRETSLNCLFLTAGYMALHGRSENSEGLDRKMCINYYSRIRLTLNLLPLLQTAASNHHLSRVITVLAAGSEGEVRLDDLDLRRDFTLHACLAHCVIMTDFMVEELARRFPSVAFSHSFPGTVKTGLVNELTGPVRLAVKVLYAVMSPWIMNVRESGERHFFQMTNLCYPARDGGVGIAVPENMDVVVGSDGVRGSGGYLLDWDGKAAGDTEVLDKYRRLDMGARVWEHTMAIFEQAVRRRDERLGEVQRGAGKRPASSSAEGDGRAARNPQGWRPAQ